MNKRSGPQGHDKPTAKKAAKKATTSRRTSSASSRAVRKSTRAAPAGSTAPMVDADVRRAMVAQAAYFRAERRGFAPGGDLEDWIAAEREIERMLGH